jgi:hypothetical protein
MQVVPERSGVVQLLVVFGGFLVGPLAALRLSQALAPRSGIMQGIAPISFALIFFLGLVVWTGIGIVMVVLASLSRLVRTGRLGVEGVTATDRLVPPGPRSFAVFGGLIGAGLGLANGLLADLPLVTAVAVWTGAGLAYGYALRLAARHGYLPFAEPE